MHFGIETERDENVDECLAAMEWLFPCPSTDLDDTYGGPDRGCSGVSQCCPRIAWRKSIRGTAMSTVSRNDQRTADRPRRRLYRSRRHRVIAGVCGGLAEYLGWSPTRVRVLTLLSFLLPGTQVIIYILLWIFVPNEPRY